MEYRTGSEIREMFLRFFELKGHRRVHSSSLVPANDPTLLFTNAGMNQFKDVFLGAEHRDYACATSSQKCVRAGGKHNDLENVGFTRRHHTFFEMLGNFSFGDYFKADAIAYAWELITSPVWFGIPKDKLYVTIFKGENGVARDEEAYELWRGQGVPADRIYEFGMKDNFWQMGETGPCGPCSEIFYDMGLEATESTGPDGQKQDLPFGEDDARYVEIWNLVFMQFERSLNAAGEADLKPLPRPSIDTGMGLERLAAVLQGKVSNFETDLFTPLIERAAELTNFKYPEVTPSASVLITSAIETALTGEQRLLARVQNASLRIISDHARAATFLINDGVVPANEGRGYVLRKILRRAIRHGRFLGQEKVFMRDMVSAVRDNMQGAYPELITSAQRIAERVGLEEKQFDRVLKWGSTKLDEELRSAKEVVVRRAHEAGLEPVIRQHYLTEYLDGNFYLPYDLGSQQAGSHYLVYRKYIDQSAAGQAVLDGRVAFSLYETFGLPLDFIADAVRDADVHLDLEIFELARAEEQARARASWKGGTQKSASPVFRDLPKTDFEGFFQLAVKSAEVLAIIKDGGGIHQANPGDLVEIVLDQTSFYADSGGQVGDQGWFYSEDHNSIVAEITGCFSPVQGVRAHRAIIRQPIAVGDKLDTVVDTNYRNSTRRNHTGTHLLHAALREVLGTHVKQAGSLVDPTRLRFDFSHFASIADEELQQIEDIVNRQVLANIAVETIVDVPIDVAVNEYHAMALFGEKYGDKVRVVKIGDFSTELCGGTHTGATGEIGVIKLLGENSVSSGVRRIEALTGVGALNEFRRDYEAAQFATHLAATPELAPAEALRHRFNAQEEELKKLRRELDEARMKSVASSLASATTQAVEVKGVKVLAQRVDALDRGQMRTLVDNLRNKLGSGVVVLGSADAEGKVALIVGVTKDLTARLQAGKIINPIAKLVGGSGGGRPDMAEAGGKDATQLEAALASAPEAVGALLG